MSEGQDRYELARTALAQIPHGVAIIGAADGEERSCATGTCMYVSLSPALVAVAEHPGSRTTRLIQRSREFSVSLLHAAQQDQAIAAGRSAPGTDKFETLRIRPLDPPEGLRAPGVAGSIAVLWCRVLDERPTGDHVLFVGEVVGHTVDASKRDALLRYRRRYTHVGHWTSDEAPEGYPT
ncbi:MAG TPA: flavin reductase family protein [Candidatus Limnocylindria bacterium]|nr:flavin reductase family protein [Candidatus Limnocylindria bacterium]